MTGAAADETRPRDGPAADPPDRSAATFLVLAPFGRDAALLADLARRAGLDARNVKREADLVGGLRDGFAALVLTQEALTDRCREAVADGVAGQPSWSSAPILVLADPGRIVAQLLQPLRQLGPQVEVLVIERPARADSIVSAMRAMLSSRERQFLVARQLAELEAQRDRLQFLMAELDHRVKNMLAKVMSIANLASKEAESLDAFRRSFRSRVQSLARAHDLVAGKGGRKVALAALVAGTFAPYAEDAQTNTHIAGPDVSLSPKIALTISMVLHELATNAAKYGALSVAGGRVAVEWALRDASGQELALTWREEGGPEVAPPARRGFGTAMIEKVAAAELNGAVDLAFPPEGLCCSLRIPLAQDT